MILLNLIRGGLAVKPPTPRAAPRGFTLNQILTEIESIFKFKDLVPMPADTVGITARVNTP